MGHVWEGIDVRLRELLIPKDSHSSYFNDRGSEKEEGRNSDRLEKSLSERELKLHGRVSRSFSAMYIERD